MGEVDSGIGEAVGSFVVVVVVDVGRLAALLRQSGMDVESAVGLPVDVAVETVV